MMIKTKKEQPRVALYRFEQIMSAILNYLSWWIANLGVVPLFLFAAFLFWPDLFFLFTLLFLVTLVLDTIIQPLFGLRKHFNLSIRQSLLPVLAILVNLNCVQALEFPLNERNLVDSQYNETIIMRIGEVHILPQSNLVNFSVSQKDIINAKYIPKKTSLLVKGKKLGVSQLLVWTPKLKTYDVSVIPKKKYDTYKSILNEITPLGLNAIYLNKKISIHGTIWDEDVYKKIISLAQEHSISVEHLSLSDGLQVQLRLKLIRHLFNKQHLNYSCQMNGVSFQCYHPKTDPPRIDEKNELNQMFFIKFTQMAKSIHEKKNYTLLIKYLEIDNRGDQYIDLGLSHLNLTYHEILNDTFRDIISRRNILLNEEKTKISKEHTQRLQILVNKDSSFSLGQDNEYRSINKHGDVTSLWKFSGLKMKLKLLKEEEDFKLIYSTQSTQKNNLKSISGAKGNSEIILKLKRPILLFDLNHSANIDKINQIPVLGNIPYLGNLFSYQNEIKLNKRFVVYATLEEAL